MSRHTVAIVGASADALAHGAELFKEITHDNTN
jgi:hypothetical protein